jgi:hypothetical protein
MTWLRHFLQVLLLCLPLPLLAAGTVTHLAGTLSVRKPDGAVKILSQHSEVHSGDLLSTEKDTYAQIKFSDGGVVTLKPQTQLKIEDYSFDKEAPAKDNFLFSLVKGGLRALTGMIGKRGNQDAYRLATPTATIGIRGTYLGLDVVPPDGGLPPGVYLVVFDGVVVAFNEAGFQAFQAGQYGFMQSLQTPPVILPADPGIHFTPPPNFTSGGPAACVVR